VMELSSQYKVEEHIVQQNDHFDDKGGDEEEMYEAELVAKKISEAFHAYKGESLRHHVEIPQDPAMNKAMMAITRCMKRSLKNLCLCIRKCITLRLELLLK